MELLVGQPTMQMLIAAPSTKYPRPCTAGRRTQSYWGAKRHQEHCPGDPHHHQRLATALHHGSCRDTASKAPKPPPRASSGPAGHRGSGTDSTANGSLFWAGRVDPNGQVPHKTQRERIGCRCPSPALAAGCKGHAEITCDDRPVVVCRGNVRRGGANESENACVDAPNKHTR